MLGGGSVLNAMLYVRGNVENYDEWEAEGATGWGYKDVLPYFLKLEDNRNIKDLDQGNFKIQVLKKRVYARIKVSTFFSHYILECEIHV